MTPLSDRLLRRLRLRHIELIELLGTVGSLRVAAESMNLSQPAVSKMLRELETAFATPLFERGKAGVTPTPAGELAIRHAMAIRNEVALIGDAVASLTAGNGQLLRVGTFSATAVVPAAILHLRTAHPQSQIHLREGPASTLVDWLLHNELDAVVGAVPPGSLGQDTLDRLTVRPFAADRLCVIASRAHRLARRRRIQWAELAGSQWVLPPAHAMLRQAFMGACLQQQLPPPPPAIETVSPLTLQRLVRKNSSLLGVTRSEQLQAELSADLIELPVYPRVELPPLSLLTRRGAVVASVLVEPFFQSLCNVAPSDTASSPASAS